MAEVVGIIASGIALGQAACAIGKGIGLLRSIANANEEFWDFLNELESLKAAVETNSLALEDLDATNNPRLQPYLARLDTVRASLVQAFGALETITTRVLAKSKGQNDQGQHRIPKVLWQREKNGIFKLRDVCRQSHRQMTDCMVIMMAVEKQQTLTLDVHMILEGKSSTRHHAATRPTENGSLDLDSGQEKASGDDEHAGSELVPFDSAVSNANQLEHILQRKQATQNSGQPNSGPHPTALTIHATVRERCPENCGCQCHIISVKRSPPWLASVLGNLLVYYDSFPVLDRRPCNTFLCRASLRTIRAQYQFPSWLLRRSVHIKACWDVLTGTGSTLHWKVPRVNKPPFIWEAIREDNKAWFQTLIAERKLLPSDTDAAGYPWIMRCDTAGAENIIQLLLENNFDLWAANPDGCAAIAHPEHLNTCDDLGWTPLHLAVSMGDNEAVETLLDSGCDMEKRALLSGETALFVAALHREVALARTLIERGANMAITCWGMTLLELAVRDASADFVQLLLDAGANLPPSILHPLTVCESIDMNEISRVIKILQKHGADVDWRNEWGGSVLLTALVRRKDNHFVAEALATAGADFDTVDSKNRNLLFWMAERKSPRWIYHLDAAYWRGTDPDLKNNVGYSALDVLTFLCAHNLPLPVTRKVREIIGLAELIAEIREMNWNDGLFLDMKHRLSEDDSHRKLKRWIRFVQEQVDNDPNFAEEEWDEDTMIWYDDIELEDGLEDDDDALDIHSLTLRKPRDYNDSDEESQYGDDSDDEESQETSDSEDEFFDAPEP
ncbi:uncharacterized protein E0L32_000878 [Thyridium curvatum]|uniref:Uncharacterized protein n=1 Tax=Thyridium curvatum TaxID=1093900 RepID=A0A507B6P3_9PEZI|nr:uncharacterized protein E0L32_000878 [Thyridium curvatum]TPX12701.1 hypothetical protein E0L32_000878 [Thyridium curvatum]